MSNTFVIKGFDGERKLHGKVSITGAKGVLFAIAGGDDLGMLEIQDAARVITESIDPHAKVIFGAIRDEKLKKNEIKVTVIATGFPELEGATPSSYARQTPQVRDKIEEEPQSVRGRIFNSIGGPARNNEDEARPIPREEVRPTAQVTPKEPKPVDPVDEDDDDDWGAVPAFLRRSKLK